MDVIHQFDKYVEFILCIHYFDSNNLGQCSFAKSCMSVYMLLDVDFSMKVYVSKITAKKIPFC